VLLAAMRKQTTAVTNAWLAGRLDIGAPAGTSQYARCLSPRFSINDTSGGLITLQGRRAG